MSAAGGVLTARGLQKKGTIGTRVRGTRTGEEAEGGGQRSAAGASERGTFHCQVQVPSVGVGAYWRGDIRVRRGAEQLRIARGHLDK